MRSLRTLGLVLLFTLAAGALAGSGYSGAAATSGSLTMTSDAGDWVGQGLAWSYATPAASFDTWGNALTYDGNAIRVNVQTSAGDFWSLGFQAPHGERLTAGVTYPGAIRGLQSSPPIGSEPRMDVFGNGRGCNTLTGSFSVLAVTYGPYGYLQSAHVSFEQHCEGAAAALHGDVNVTAPPAPPAAALTISISGAGTVGRHDGEAHVSGTVECTQPVGSALNVSVSEPQKKGTASATASVPFTCSPSAAPAPWSADVASQTAIAFGSGKATVQASGSVFDGYYTGYLGGNPVYGTGSASALVSLAVGR